MSKYFILVVYWCIKNVELQSFRIAGGKVAKKHQFPFFVQMRILSRKRSRFGGMCGGSLIHQQWMLTAAHCLLYDELKSLLDEDGIMIYMGSNEMYDESAAVNYIKEAHKHPGFYINYPDSIDEKEVRNDIAVCKLKYPYSFDRTIGTIYLSPPISNLKKWTKRCRHGTAMGIGLTYEPTYNNSQPLLPTHLLYAGQDPTHRDEIKNFYVSPIPEAISQKNTTFFAVARKSHGHTLQGDSGGPFICYKKGTPVQYGVLSTGFTRKSPKGKYDVAVFERVDVHLNFIRSLVPYINTYDPYWINKASGYN